MSEVLTASRVIGNDGNIRYDVQSEPTEYILGNKRRLNFMWDTGAFISVLSVANFVKNRDSEDYKRLEKSIDDDVEFIDYNSVSGSGKGVLRKIKNLRINGLLIESFYFLLVKDVKRVVNCILNYLYCELEGRKIPPYYGPVTFGEVAYQLMNQTLVYCEIL